MSLWQLFGASVPSRVNRARRRFFFSVGCCAVAAGCLGEGETAAPASSQKPGEIAIQPSFVFDEASLKALAAAMPASPKDGKNGNNSQTAVDPAAFKALQALLMSKPEDAVLDPGLKLPGLKDGDPGPFLTEAVSAVETDDQKWGSTTFLYPGKTKVQQPWHDVPFVLHVPFNQPFDGGSVRVYLSANFRWDQPEANYIRSQPNANGSVEKFPSFDLGNGMGSRIAAMTFGVYRPDGQALPDNSVFVRQGGEPEKPMTFVPGAPTPLWVAGKPPADAKSPGDSFAGMLSTMSTSERLKPFVSVNHMFAGSGYIEFRPAKAGWYVLWITLYPWMYDAWPSPALRPDDTLHATARVDTLVTRLNPEEGGLSIFPARDVVDYLFLRQGNKPDLIQDESVLIPQSVELPLVFQRDGWKFDYAEIQPTESGRALLRRLDETGDASVTSPIKLTARAEPEKDGASLGLGIQAFIRRRDGLDPRYTYEGRWALTVPIDIPDESAAPVAVTGKHSVQYSEPTFETYDPDPVPAWSALVPPDKQSDPYTVQEYLPVIIAGNGVGRDRYMSDYSRRLKDPDGAQWFPSRLVSWTGPADNPAERYLYWFETIRPEEGADSLKQLLFRDRGPQALFGFQLGPWSVQAMYRRKKDVHAAASQEIARAPEETALQEDDGYYDWIVAQNTQRDAVQSRVQAILLQLQVMRRQSQAARAKWFELERLDQKSFPADTTPNAGLVDSALTFGQHLLNGGSDIRFAPTITQTMLTALKEDRDALQTQMASLRSDQAALIEEARQLEQSLLEAATRQIDRSRDRADHRRKVAAAVDHFTDQRDLTRLYLYEAAGWYGTAELQQAITDLQIGSQSVQALADLMQAKSWLAAAREAEMRLAISYASPNPVPPNSPAEQNARADRVKAMNALRAALAAAPADADAKRMLQDVELELLSWIPPKLEREKHLSMEAFNKYMTVRGYNPDVPSGWWDGFKEVASAFWGSSPITLGEGLPWQNAAAEVARLTDDTQTAIAKNQISLLVIRRLVRGGVSLAQIKSLTPDELARRLAPNTLDQQPLDPAKAHRLCQDLHETFAELYDLQALASGNADDFNQFLGQSYYGSFNPDKTWVQTIGDLVVSPGGLLMFFGPGAVARVGGQWVTSPFAALPAAGSLAGQGAKVETAQQILSSALRLEDFGQKIAGTGVGKALVKAIVADQQFLQNSSRLERFLNSGSRLAASVVIYGGAAHAAEQSGIPGARILVDAIGILGGEDAAVDILTRNGALSPAALAEVDALAVAVARERAELTAATTTAADFAAIQQRLSTSKKSIEDVTNEAERKELDAVLTETAPAPAAPAEVTVAAPHPAADSASATVTAPAPEAASSVTQVPAAKLAGEPTLSGPAPVRPPAIDRKADAADCLRAGARALKDGNSAEAGRALAAVRELDEEMTSVVEEVGKKVAQVRVTMRKPALPIAVTPQRAIGPMSGGDAPAQFFADVGGAEDAVARTLLKGDSALMRGDLEAASDFYAQAARDADAGGRIESIKLVDDRRVLAATAKSEARSYRAMGDAVAANTESALALSADQAAGVGQRCVGGDLKIDQLPGSLNPVYLIKDSSGATQFVFKHLTDEEEIAGEMFAAAVADKLGVRAPACQRVKIPGLTVSIPIKDPATGNIIRTVTEDASGILVRAVDGNMLWGMRETGVIAMKQEYAEQRVFRLWLGDTDGHFKNIMLGKDGHLWPIDFGMVSLRKEGFLKQFRDRDGKMFQVADAERYLENAVNFPAAIARDNANGKLYHWVDTMDGALSYDEMAATVKKIKALCDEDSGQALRELLNRTVPAEQVDEFVGVLRQRATLLEGVLKKKFPTLGPTGALDQATGARWTSRVVESVRPYLRHFGERDRAPAAWGTGELAPLALAA